MFLLTLLACKGDDPAVRTPQATSTDPSLPVATAYRLTDPQLRATIQQVLGVEYTGVLPTDYTLHGYVSVGSATLSLPPYDLELVEAAAWSVAETLLADGATRDLVLGCPLDLLPDGEARACVERWAVATAFSLWHRPIEVTERAVLGDLFDAATAESDRLLASRGVLAFVLQSPWFVYRVEFGEPDPETPGRWRYTDHEMAARLSFLLAGAAPDAERMAAADRGELTSVAGVVAEAERLLDQPGAADPLAGWFAETLDLDRLDAAVKDATLFPEWNDDLKLAMRSEIELLFSDLVVLRDEDFRALLTTDETWVNPSLAAVYGIAAPDPAGTAWATLAPGRGGILARGAVLAGHANATLNSPTRRGKFVRAKLLCQSIPPPPEGVVASLDGVALDTTLRELLARHSEDPACAGCHALMDPIGFGLEQFDPIGRWRELDNGYPIDTTGDLDGTTFEGAEQLAETVAAHPSLASCIALDLWLHGTGQAETGPMLPAIDEIGAEFASSEFSFRSLVLAFVASDGFRRPSPGSAGPPTEACNGRDDDEDGAVDEVLRPCGGSIQACDDGAWPACEPEACGPVEILLQTSAELQGFHAGCDLAADPMSPDCRAAFHRACAATECGVSGYGPVTAGTGAVALACLDERRATVVTTSFTELSIQHGGCHAGARQGPDCNAAISRHCAALGLTTGYGPVENEGDTAVIVCTPGAWVADPTYPVLATYDPVCDGTQQRWGPDCSEAFHGWCQDQGYASGHGPLENFGDAAVAACVDGGE